MEFQRVLEAGGLRLHDFKMSKTKVVLILLILLVIFRRWMLALSQTSKPSFRYIQMRWIIAELESGSAANVERAKADMRQAIEWGSVRGTKYLLLLSKIAGER